MQRIKYNIKQFFKVLKTVIKDDVWLIEGTEKSSKKPLKIVYIGSEIQRNFIAVIAFSEGYKQKYIGKKTFWNIFYILNTNKYKVSLAVVEGFVFHRLFIKTKKDFFIPIWIETCVDLPLVPMNRSAKEDLRRVRKNKLEYIITTEKSLLDDFYYNMFLPFLCW